MTQPGKSRKQQLEEMLAESPDDPELRYFLAMEFVSAGDDERAVRCFEELIKIGPNYVPAYLQAGQALVRLGREEQAREVFRSGIAVARQVGDPHAEGEMTAFLDSLS